MAETARPVRHSPCYSLPPVGIDKMALHPSRTHEFSAEGEVVEILEGVHELRAKILLKPGTVLDLAVGGEADVHLGDQVEFEASVTLHSLRARVDALRDDRDA